MEKTRWVLIAGCALALVLSGCQNRPCRTVRAPELDQTERPPPVQPDAIPVAMNGPAVLVSPGAPLLSAQPVSTSDDERLLTPGAQRRKSLRVLVYRPEGSKFCEPKSGVSLSVMEKQLAGIAIFRKISTTDGILRAQVCGAATGRVNVFEISREDLSQAMKLGFLEFKNLPGVESVTK